jgi:phosphoribosyl 1,2-cyclic phosphate phosphodiesterase
MRGVKVLVINALRIEEHMSHINLAEALEIIEKVKPQKAYLTHISHHMGKHADVQPTLPDNVALAYDGLSITI